MAGKRKEERRLFGRKQFGLTQQSPGSCDSVTAKTAMTCGMKTEYARQRWLQAWQNLQVGWPDPWKRRKLLQ